MLLSRILIILSGALTVYMLLIFIRILISWFQGPYVSGPVRILAAITDPYLNIFRRFRIFRAGPMDFSPIVGILVLVIVNNILSSIATHGSVTLGYVLAVIVSAVWSAVSFFILFFIIISIVRLIALHAGASSASPFWMTVDRMIEPLAYRITRLFMRGKSPTYTNGLLVTIGFLIALYFIGNFLINQLVYLLASIPF